MKLASSLKKMTNKSFFQVQSSFKVDYAPANIKKWRSTRTGLQLTVVQQDCPIVNGYFAVATEIMNDSGCPHTLEHLIFMGSKKYPYKGLLDVLGNLAFSSTNAWTATDQTVYTLTTAGWDGFKMLLPVYLDHLFNATLTDEACYTEVYHVDGAGKDKGVVYSEMQAIETQSWFITGLEAQRTLYEKSGYKSETGGLTSNLRTLTNDEIRKFHKDNYRPDNLCIILTGTVNEEEFLELMTEFDSELPDLPSVPSKRPFVDSDIDGPLKKKITKTVEFPDKDESSGEILMSWIGPDCKSTLENQALDVLGSYLTNSSISLFSKKFIEIDNPLATSSEYYTEDFINTGLNLSFSSVPTKELSGLSTRILETLSSHCDPKEFDLVRVRDVLEQMKWKFIYSCEVSSEAFSTLAIFEFLYGNRDGSDLSPWIKDLKEFDILSLWTAEQWCDLLRKYFVDNHCAVFLSKPSKSLYKVLKEEDKKLIEDRKANLGESGLKELENKLKHAQAKNDTPIPDAILEKFGQPDPSKIDFIKTKSVTVGPTTETSDTTQEASLVDYINKDTPADFPLYVHFEDIQSNFVSVNILLSSFTIDKELLPYLDIFVSLFSFPIVLEDGTKIPYEEVVANLKRDTISAEPSISFYSHYEELITFKILAKKDNYSKVIDWFYKLFYQSDFDEQRVKVTLEKAIKRFPDLKRNGSVLLKSLISRTTNTDRSIAKAKDFLEIESFIKSSLEKINNGQFQDIKNDLEKIRKQLFTPENMRILVIGQIETIENPVSTWTKNFIKDKSPKVSKPLIPLPLSMDVLSEIGKSKSNKAFLITSPGSESTYLNSITGIPTEYTHPDIPKISLAAEYLQCVEGPFWRGIRGTGLAYGANIYLDVDYGQLVFSIYRGADAEKALQVGKEIVENYANGVVNIEQKMMEGAISSIVNGMVNSESDFFRAASYKFLDNYLIKRGPDYNAKLLKVLRTITIEELLETIKRYFVPLFNSKSSILFASVNPSRSDALKKNLEEVHGYSVEVENITSSGEEGNDDESGDDESDDESGSEDDSSSEEEADEE